MKKIILDLRELEGNKSNKLEEATKSILEKESQELINPFSKYYENYSSLGNKIIGKEY